MPFSFRAFSRVSCLAGLSVLAACSSSSTQPADSGTILLDVGLIQLDSGKPHHDGGTKHEAGGSHDSGPGDTGGGGDVGAEAGDSPDAEATYPWLNQFVAPYVQDYGGTVVQNPVFVPVIFTGDPFTAQIEAFVGAIGGSSYWMQAVSEYGVGTASAGSPIFLNETMPNIIDDSQVQVWLANRIGTDPQFGAIPGEDGGGFDAGSIDAGAPLSPLINQNARVPANVVYALYFPAGTTLTLSEGVNGGGGKTSSCGNGFGGYHSNFRMPNGSNVTYAMIPRCGSYAGFTGFDVISAVSSHEFAEAATDPEVSTHPAFGGTDNEHEIWEQVLGGGEIGDMCAQFPQAFYNPAEAALSGYVVQRIWSNAAAHAGQDPCRPLLPGEVYYNTVPHVGLVNTVVNMQNIAMYGTTIPVGQTAIVELDLFSDAPTPAGWQIQPQDLGVFNGTGANLSFSLLNLDDGGMAVGGSNGQKLRLKITAMQAGQGGLSPYLLFSNLAGATNWWIGLVVNE